MSIKHNDMVRVAASSIFSLKYQDEVGRVERVYEMDPFLKDGVALVDFCDGGLVKLPFKDLIKIIPPKAGETKADTQEGVKRITKEDYDRAVMRVVADIDDPRRLLGNISAMIVARNIGEEIFENRDDVFMTKDQFIATLWNGCSPEKVSESVNNTMSTQKCIDVSISGMICLRMTVNILFGESENA